MTRNMRVLNALLAAVLLFGIAVPAFALPTPTDTRVEWTAYTGNATGFYLYWAIEAPDRTYVDTRKVDISKPANSSVTVVTVMPTAEDRLCFKLTAYRRVPGQPEIESVFSTEACGFFGIIGPTGLIIKP